MGMNRIWMSFPLINNSIGVARVGHMMIIQHMAAGELRDAPSQRELIFDYTYCHFIL